MQEPEQNTKGKDVSWKALVGLIGSQIFNFRCHIHLGAFLMVKLVVKGLDHSKISKFEESIV